MERWERVSRRGTAAVGPAAGVQGEREPAMKAISDFKTFILRGNVVDLAVGIVIGAAFGTVIAAFVKDLVTPLIAAIGGQPDFSALSFTVNHSKFLYGDFVNTIISFLIIAAVIFFFVVRPV